ncbi:MAG: phosphoenolpyruvate synthase, partial [Gemmatimonadota bacterium]|nr:phosphoenolpyruvate synthase [Gemmatimonadota bacterium]
MAGIDDRYVRWLETLGSDDVSTVGGKNASLGEMIAALSDAGIRVPAGFATTADAYREFLSENELDEAIAERLADLDGGEGTLEETARWIREAIRGGDLPDALVESIRAAYRELGERYDAEDVDVAVRTSATAEDLPEASFAGQQETFLNVVGEDALLEKVRDCFASLFTDRAIVYRREHGFDHMEVALSAGVQKMVRSDLAGAGVLFTIDTETGFPDVVRIDAAWGLGEAVVGGTVDPDHYSVYKPFLDDSGKVPILWKDRGRKATKIVYARSGPDPTVTVETRGVERRAYVLSDEEILTLARWGRTIEEHYDRPMDVEWAKDGYDDELYVVQARPETVQSRKGGATMSSYSLSETGEVLVEGAAVGDAIAAANACVLEDVSEIDRFQEGCILVTRRTDPDWVPIMRQAAAIVTDHGGRTSHAAIVSRELGIPAVVGTGDATRTIEDGREITLSCAEGEVGVVYDGILEYAVEEIELEDAPETRTRVMMNIASPRAALRWWLLPARGVGLARVELVVGN